MKLVNRMHIVAGKHVAMSRVGLRILELVFLRMCELLFFPK